MTQESDAKLGQSTEEKMTRHSTVFVLAAIAATSLCSGVVRAQTPSSAPAQPQSLANTYRGMFVCEKVPGSADILHVPLDLAIRGSQIESARPLFNLGGTRVLGSELGWGSVDDGGKVHITSTWDVRGIAVHGDYSGTLTPSGGTLTGTQSWRGQDGEPRSRTCQAALVPSANAQRVAE
jgi:hypothetical protein